MGEPLSLLVRQGEEGDAASTYSGKRREEREGKERSASFVVHSPLSKGGQKREKKRAGGSVF